MTFSKARNIGGDLAGSIGDLGTFLPYVIGAITIASLDVTSVLVMFGLMYLFTAWFYRVPVPVQPMKVIGAAIIIHHFTPAEIAAAGMLTGAMLLAIGLSGLIDKIVQLTPVPVTMGIQTGLGISLAILGIEMAGSDWALGLPILVVMLLLLNNRYLPASIVALVGGTGLYLLLHPGTTLPVLNWQLTLPHTIWPSWADFNRGFLQGALPQLPLTLTNSVLVTAYLAAQLFPESSQRVNHKNLCLTLGIGNLIGAPLGMIPVCHGSGGLAAHYRFGARSEYALVFIGGLLLIIGLFLGSSGLQLLQIIPPAVLGGMLFYSGLDLIHPLKSTDSKDIFLFAAVVVLSIALNPAVGFAAGIAIFLLSKKIKIQ